jgi:hypothetical protein
VPVPDSISTAYAAFEGTAAAALSISFGIRNCDMMTDECTPILLQQLDTFSLSVSKFKI